MQFKEVPLTKHGNNANIKVKPLSDYIMRYVGFTDRVESRWYKCVLFENDISFNVTVEKDGSDWQIDVLDEVFCQPYDYQYMLEHHPPHFAYKVKQFVDNEMRKLVKVGIVSNWNVGDYI